MTENIYFQLAFISFMPSWILPEIKVPINVNENFILEAASRGRCGKGYQVKRQNRKVATLIRCHFNHNMNYNILIWSFYLELRFLVRGKCLGIYQINSGG